MGNIIKTIENPKDIADIIFRAAESECDEIIQKNLIRAERFQEPLEMPALNVKQMLENIKKLTEKTFANPHFQRYASEHPWNGRTSAKAWEEAAAQTLIDCYLLPTAREDAALFQQMYKIWPEMEPLPNLTKEQRAELAELQLQADDIIKKATALEAEFIKLAEREKNIIKNTQLKLKTLIADQTIYFRVNKNYYQEYVQKWR